MVQAAAELVLRRFFGPGEADADKVSWLASAACVSMAEMTRLLDERQAGAVIRSALGEPAPGLDALTPADKSVLQGAVTSLASINMDLDEAAVDELVREAERVTFERGWHPPLAPRGRIGAERS